MKKQLLYFIMISLSICFVSLLGGIYKTQIISAKSTNVYKAYAAAIKNGSIRIEEKGNQEDGTEPKGWLLQDLNGDGIKELILNKDAGETSLEIFQYINKKVKRTVKFYPEYNISYDKKNKIFWMSGEGDGCWLVAYQYRNRKLIESKRYQGELTQGEKKYHYFLKIKKSEMKISYKKYTSISKQIKRKGYHFKKSSADELVYKLIKMK